REGSLETRTYETFRFAKSRTRASRPGLQSIVLVGRVASVVAPKLCRDEELGSLGRSMRISLLSLLLLPLLCCSCSMVLCNTVPTKTGGAMRPGAARAELVRRLGQPSVRTSVPIPATVRLLRTNSPPCSCDIYHVSGLVRVGNDTYSTDWN